MIKKENGVRPLLLSHL